jgi:competence protein ComEA
MKDLWKILFGALFAFLGVGAILWVSGRPRGQPVALTPLPSPAPLFIHVTGAVIRPGVYSLPVRSRIWDAVQAAGGFSPQADQSALNLAAFLEDGSQIEIPLLGTSAPIEKIAASVETTMTPTPSPAPPTETPYPRIDYPININTATALELEVLPQIGQVRAARIVGYRKVHGPFKRIEDIRQVYDINADVYAAIRDLISVGESPGSPSPTP